MFMFHSYKWVFCLVMEKPRIEYGPKFVFALLFLHFPGYQMVKFFSLLHGFGSDLFSQVFSCPHLYLAQLSDGLCYVFWS